MKNLYKYSKSYSGYNPELIENDIFRIFVPLKKIEESVANVPVNVPVNVQESQILQLIKDDKIERSTDIVKYIDKSQKQIKRYLEHLKILGLIEFMGSSKKGRYLLTKKGEDIMSCNPLL